MVYTRKEYTDRRQKRLEARVTFEAKTHLYAEVLPQLLKLLPQMLKAVELWF